MQHNVVVGAAWGRVSVDVVEEWEFVRGGWGRTSPAGGVHPPPQISTLESMWICPCGKCVASGNSSWPTCPKLHPAVLTDNRAPSVADFAAAGFPLHAWYTFSFFQHFGDQHRARNRGIWVVAASF